MKSATLVFDLDGTLVDTAGDLLGTLNDILKPEGIPPLTRDDVRRAVGHGARRMIATAYELAGRSAEDADLDRLMDAFVARYANRIARESRPYPGVIDALDHFGRTGWRHAICTNKFEALAVQLIDELELSDRFSAICGQDTFPYRKPDARALTGTIARAGGDRARAVMVGDSETDVQTARAAGVPIIVVSFGYATVPAADLGADVVIDHFDQLAHAVTDVAPALQPS